MNRREPAAGAARAKLEWSWLYLGLVVFMLCRVASSGSAAFLASSAMSAERQAHEHERRRDDVPCTAREIMALQGETPSEDATSDMPVVVSRLAVEQTFYCRVGVGDRVIPTHDAHLLISTGLGRGPPIG